MDKIFWLLVLALCVYIIYKLAFTPYPAWKYMDEQEKKFYKKWFILPRLWK